MAATIRQAAPKGSGLDSRGGPGARRADRLSGAGRHRAPRPPGNSRPAPPPPTPRSTAVPRTSPTCRRSTARHRPARRTSTGQGTATGTGPAEAGLPATVLAAYKKAERPRSARPTRAASCPGNCSPHIGKVESGPGPRRPASTQNGTTISRGSSARSSTATASRTSVTPTTVFYDGDSSFDRAVGPMQFIPSTWVMVCRLAPTATATARRTPTTSTTPRSPRAATSAPATATCRSRTTWTAAILGYNHSEDYLRTVLSWLRRSTATAPTRSRTARASLPVHRGGASPATTAPAAPAVRTTATAPTHRRRRARAIRHRQARQARQGAAQPPRQARRRHR